MKQEIRYIIYYSSGCIGKCIVRKIHCIYDLVNTKNGFQRRNNIDFNFVLVVLQNRLCRVSDRTVFTENGLNIGSF